MRFAVVLASVIFLHVLLNSFLIIQASSGAQGVSGGGVSSCHKTAWVRSRIGGAISPFSHIT